jgi:hypothetical protein
VHDDVLIRQLEAIEQRLKMIDAAIAAQLELAEEIEFFMAQLRELARTQVRVAEDLSRAVGDAAHDAKHERPI